MKQLLETGRGSFLGPGLLLLKFASSSVCMSEGHNSRALQGSDSLQNLISMKDCCRCTCRTTIPEYLTWIQQISIHCITLDFHSETILIQISTRVQLRKSSIMPKGFDFGFSTSKRFYYFALTHILAS